jgi:hypothetical protein
MSRITDVLSIDVDTPGQLHDSIIGGSAFKGFEVRTADGRLATLAVVDDQGEIIESGPNVLTEAWIVAVMAYQRFLEGEGQLRVVSCPGRLKREDKAP